MARKFNVMPICHDKEPCFGRNGELCTILQETYPTGVRCPFRKADQGDKAVRGRIVPPPAKKRKSASWISGRNSDTARDDEWIARRI